MMKLQDILLPSFKSRGIDLRIPVGTPPPGKPSIVESCLADDSDFCRETVARGWLSAAQMHHAAMRYQLGKSRSGKTIFWMIGPRGTVSDGHIGSAWVSQMLKARHPELTKHCTVSHCLFGLHLLATEKSVAVVESERSAVILSELYPQCLWLAYAYPANFTVDKLAPLRGRRVTLYPRTDPAGEHFTACLETADCARRLYGLDIGVSSFLEDHATAEQKQAEADLAGFLFEELNSSFVC